MTKINRLSVIINAVIVAIVVVAILSNKTSIAFAAFALICLLNAVECTKKYRHMEQKKKSVLVFAVLFYLCFVSALVISILGVPFG